jgi:hypothetical protein
LDDETGVKEACADLMSGGREKAVGGLNEGEGMAFGIFESETWRAGFVFGDGAGFDFVSDEIFVHLREVWSRKSDFSEEIFGRTTGYLLEFDALAAVDGIAGVGDAKTGGGGGIEAENF